jgi:hypothetical protein
MFPKASVLPKELEQVAPAGVAKLIVDTEVDPEEELEESPPPPQAVNMVRTETIKSAA